MANILLTANEVAHLLGVSKGTIKNWKNPKSRYYRPDFPKPLKLSARVIRWQLKEIEDYFVNFDTNYEE
ncbi:helix-turn-helix transcriptional regulator [Neisseria cinerea]|uniref:helix-turn-helix transcriptional regulator n=1 Tax=Neisseria cinerea TaxID=483 RepID=UPI0027E0AE6F|nr:AlpA family phage regulatory protein [Neisseria cinerea]